MTFLDEIMVNNGVPVLYEEMTVSPTKKEKTFKWIYLLFPFIVFVLIFKKK